MGLGQVTSCPKPGLVTTEGPQLPTSTECQVTPQPAHGANTERERKEGEEGLTVLSQEGSRPCGQGCCHLGDSPSPRVRRGGVRYGAKHTALCSLSVGLPKWQLFVNSILTEDFPLVLFDNYYWESHSHGRAHAANAAFEHCSRGQSSSARRKIAGHSERRRDSKELA